MSRRIWQMSIVITFLFAVVAGQSLWVPSFHAAALNTSPLNPRNSSANDAEPSRRNPRRQRHRPCRISSDGQWAISLRRIYPEGALFAGVIGWSSLKYGEWGLEAQYNTELSAHSLPAQSLEQVLAPTVGEDSVTLTLVPALQKLAQVKLGGTDGSVVVIVPSTGSILALYSNPTSTRRHSPHQMSTWKRQHGRKTTRTTRMATRLSGLSLRNRPSSPARRSRSSRPRALSNTSRHS